MLYDFNTSNVTIQLTCHHSFHLTADISIHLMLLFNFFSASYRALYSSYFNTSNVTIQQRPHDFLQLQLANFNTSNVTIQLVCLELYLLDNLYFNTSNVTIQRPKSVLRSMPLYISIHLMLLFNKAFL